MGENDPKINKNGHYELSTEEKQKESKLRKAERYSKIVRALAQEMNHLISVKHIYRNDPKQLKLIEETVKNNDIYWNEILEGGYQRIQRLSEDRTKSPK